jgi:hypothetical protein
MPMKGGSPDLRIVDRWESGAGWIAYPEEGMRRASHALATDDGVWVVDPVDAPGVDDLLADLGEVAGVVICLDRHERDAVGIARRHDAPVFVPDRMHGVADDLDTATERFGTRLGGTDYRALTVRNSSLPPWQEVALTDGETLYVPEAVGTAPFFRAGDERVGVHPMLRLFPPRRALGGLEPDRLLVGHGAGVEEDAARALRDALAGARRRAPAAYAGALRAALG